MPRTTPNQAPGNTSPKERLRNAIEQWKQIKDERPARSVLNEQGQSVENPAYREWLQDQNRFRREINTILGNHPELTDEAVRFGLPRRLVPSATDKGSGTGTQRDEDDSNRDRSSNGSGGGGGGGSGGGGGDNGGDGVGQAKRLLPGVKGKDFTIGILPSGQRVAIYRIKVGGQTFDIGVQIPRHRLDRYGIKRDEGRQLTRQQARRIEEIGHVEDLQPMFRGEDRNPFGALRRTLRRAYEGSEILEHDEVFGLVLAQHVFGWSDAEFQNQLKTTKWYKNTTAYKRTWELDMGTKAKRNAINEWTEQVVNKLEDIYGLDWMRHVKGGMQQAKKWAQRIASGDWGTTGDPTQGFQFWANHQEDVAAEIDGTPAAIAREQEQEALRAAANEPENMLEQIREQARTWLGPQGIDNDTLWNWAKRLADQRASDNDWMDYLRRQAKVLHPYLGDEQPWMDFASPFKSSAEQILGMQLSWDDKLLWNFGATKADGTSIPNQALSLYDFENRIRQDPRFSTSRTAQTQVADLGSALVGMFGGPTGGGF